jgi:hypothetical protein
VGMVSVRDALGSDPIRFESEKVKERLTEVM